MSQKRLKGLIRLSVLIFLIVCVGWIFVLVVFHLEDQVVVASQAERLLDGKTVVIEAAPGETIWAFYVQSGAEQAGYSLDDYVEAVARLNPGQNVNIFASGLSWEIPWVK